MLFSLKNVKFDRYVPLFPQPLSLSLSPHPTDPYSAFNFCFTLMVFAEVAKWRNDECLLDHFPVILDATVYVPDVNEPLTLIVMAELEALKSWFKRKHPIRMKSLENCPIKWNNWQDLRLKIAVISKRVEKKLENLDNLPAWQSVYESEGFRLPAFPCELCEIVHLENDEMSK